MRLNNARMNLRWVIVGLALVSVAFTQGCRKKKSGGSSDTAEAPPTAAGGQTVSGALALSGTIASTSSGSGDGASLNLLSGGTTISCQIEGDPASAVSALVDASTGEFSFAAAQVSPFIGQVVRCSVTLADGSVNVLDAFSVPADAVAGDVNATYDAASGAISDRVEVTRSSGEVVDSDSVYAPLPANLMAFNPAGITGKYARKNCEVGRNSGNAAKIAAVKSGNLAGTELTESCNGWEQQGVYLRGEPGVRGSASPVVQDTPPSLSMWNRQADYDACYASGGLEMAITDGTNSLDFGNGSGVTVDSIFAAVRDYGWAPQVALDRAAAAASSNPPADPQSAQIREILDGVYGAGDPCGGLGRDLAKDWAAAGVGLRKVGGKSICDSGLVYSSPPAQISQMLNEEIADEPNGDGGMRRDCGMYRRAKTAEGRKRAVDGFVSMCRSFIAGAPGEEETRRAKLEVVDAFLRSIGELKWQTGDSRFDALKAAMKGLDLASPSSISNSALETLAREWMAVSWDWRARRVLEFALASMSSAISGADSWLQINGMTGRQAVEAMLNNAQTRNNLEELVCADQHQMPSLVQMVGEASLTSLEAQVNAGTMQNGFQSEWKNSAPNLAGKKSLIVAFIDAFLAKNIGHCERVRLTAQKTQVNNYNGSGQWDPVTNFPRHFLGHMMNDAKRRKVLEEISALLPSGTYAQLDGKRLELAAFNMGGNDWMSEELQRYQQKGYDQAGLLYVMKQMLGGEAARSAFRYDSAYLTKLQTIKKSACLPDAQISWEPSYDANGAEVFLAQVNGPVKQIMKAPLALNGDSVRAVETKLHGGGSCYHGNVNGFTAIPSAAFASNTGFFSPYMMAWFNGCGGGGGGGDDLNGMFGASKLTPVVNE